MNTPWLHRFLARADADLRLFCFPYAGVGAVVFRGWAERLPSRVDVYGIQLPGRTSRMNEPAMTDLASMAGALATVMMPALDRPFAFFGHSMGAIVACEVAHALRRCGGPQPAHMFVSARRPPHVPPTEPPLHPLPDAEFVEELARRYGGIPTAVRNEPELLALLLPALRADIAALERHEPVQRPPLEFPITALGGTDDALTPREQLDAWRATTRSDFRVRQFPGGHFYLEHERDEVLREIATTLVQPLSSRARAQGSA
jgi:surfactin synthase thioesterase subunit